jgi:hypothetical protein
MPKIAPQEIKEITRILEEGNPLPEKFRFLFFEDKTEVISLSPNNGENEKKLNLTQQEIQEEIQELYMVLCPPRPMKPEFLVRGTEEPRVC